MSKEIHRHEKDEKDEKDEKGRHEKGEGGMEEKWRRDPLSGIFFGLIVIGVGIILLLGVRGNIDWDDWWAYLLVVIGCVFIIEALVRYAMPAYRRPMFGRLLIGLVLVAIGASSIYAFGEWWPLIVIVVGVAILLFGIARFMRPRE